MQNCSTQEDLQEYIKQCKTRLQKILQRLQWTEEGVLKNFNTNSLASSTPPKTEKISSPNIPSYPDSCVTNNSIVIDTPQLQNLLCNTQIKAPHNFRDLQANFSREQKLKIYEHVIGHTEKLENNTVVKLAEGETSLAEIVAQKKREEKRKKRKFRKSKPTHIEEVRSLVDLQMQALQQFMGNQREQNEGVWKEDKGREYKPSKRSRSRDNGRKEETKNGSYRNFKRYRSRSNEHFRGDRRRKSRSMVKTKEFKARRRSPYYERRKRDKSKERHRRKSRERKRSKSRERNRSKSKERNRSKSKSRERNIRKSRERNSSKSGGKKTDEITHRNQETESYQSKERSSYETNSRLKDYGNYYKSRAKPPNESNSRLKDFEKYYRTHSKSPDRTSSRDCQTNHRSRERNIDKKSQRSQEKHQQNLNENKLILKDYEKYHRGSRSPKSSTSRDLKLIDRSRKEKSNQKEKPYDYDSKRRRSRSREKEKYIKKEGIDKYKERNPKQSEDRNYCNKSIHKSEKHKRERSFNI